MDVGKEELRERKELDINRVYLEWGHKGVSLHVQMSLRASGRREAAAAEMLTWLLPLGSPSPPCGVAQKF